jgi:acetyl-CoA carboxylase carboxyl transferase subunit beta
MIDMVVHRHKLRETLARLCRVLTANAAVRPVKPAIDSGYLNGSMLDGNSIETLARSSNVAEPDTDEQGEPFEARDKTDQKSRTRPGSRDGARG